jgi:hypothetical protein
MDLTKQWTFTTNTLKPFIQCGEHDIAVVLWDKQDAKLIVEAVNQCISINPDNPQAVAESIKDMYAALKAISIKDCDTCHGTGYIGEDFGCPDCAAYGKVIKYTNPIDIETLIEVIAKVDRK